MTNPPIDLQPYSRRCWWLPSISTIIWLAFFLALMLSPARVKLVGSDADPCLHWQQGNWMLQHRAVLHTEVFSHTRAGAPLVDMEWLSEIVTALSGDLFGWSGVALVTAAVCATCMWLLHRQLLAEGNELLLSTALTLLAAGICATHWLARPHMATHLLVLVFAWQLRWFERGRTTARKLLVLLPLLMALWANLHGAFIFGFALIGIHFAGTVASWAGATAEQRPVLRQRATVLGILGLACVLASLLNPNGWNLLVQVIRYIFNPLLRDFAQEFRPVSIRDQSMLPFMIEAALALLMLWIVRPRLSMTDALLLTVWLGLSLRMARNAPLFALITTPILAEHWNAYLRTASPSQFIRRYRSISANLSSIDQLAGARGLPVLVMVAMILVLAKPQLFGGRPLLRTELPADRFPDGAVEFLRQCPNAVHGEMFNDYMWGGYFILVMPERKVFIHPDLGVYGEELVKEFIHVNNVQPDWEDILKKYRVGWTILPVRHPLNHVLEMNPHWTPVFSNGQALVFSRTS
jgi:hypothetical protein